MHGDGGQVLAGRFELRGKLGEGGMGVVYRAWDRTIGKDVALKRMRDVGAADVVTLKAEFRARAALQHKNLVQLYELVVDGQDCFLTMELVDGTDLSSWARGVAARAEPAQVAAVSHRTVRGGGGGTPTRESPGHPETVDAPPLDADGCLRLRVALAELCHALAVLHDAGVVHRDLTPPNVRVTPAGRVVVLDFGLAGVARNERPGSDEFIIGTPLYMAPEQARAEPATPAVDLYALGAILYELLSGRAPFVGSDSLVRLTKASGIRPEPIGTTEDPELAELATALLSPIAALRPTPRAILALLAGGAELAPTAPTFGLPSPGACFGRAAETDTLVRALNRVRDDDRPGAVIVQGPSGIGKSTVLRHFATTVQRSDPSAVVLAGRCHPQETVPFKAVDAAIDCLAECAAARDDLEALPPAQAQSAVRLFPALAIVPALSQQAAAAAPKDAQDVRQAGFAAVRELLARLAKRGPLVLVLDDVQWDDTDSRAFLSAVLAGRDAPPVLLVVGLRADSGTSAIVERLLAPRPLVPVDRIELGPLDRTGADRLATEFLGDGDPRIAHVIGQSEGNPFLLCELARYLSDRPADASLDDDVPDVHGLVAARLADLEPHQRAVLDAVSLAVRPLAIDSALAAARLDSTAHPAVLALCDAFLVRLGAEDNRATIAPYHDRIAEATRALLSDADAAGVHRGLAETLDRMEPRPWDALCVHWENAGERARAATCAYRAAEVANDTLAFGRAAELFDKAVTLGYDELAPAALMECAATAHAHHGNGPRAAERYLEASLALGDNIDDARVRTLKRLAAEQYIKSGYVAQGWSVMRSVLDAAGISQPSSPGRATLGSLGRRLRFMLRRIDPEKIGDRRIPDADRARLDILWTASTSMSMIDVTLSDAFRTQHLGRILDVGDASAIARALAYEAALEAHVGGSLFEKHTATLLDHARTLVSRTTDPYDEAWLELGVANQAYCSGRFADAAEACRRSDRILREQCTGVAWEISTVATFWLTALAMLGDVRALREATERIAADADQRGDVFLLADACSGECVLAWWSTGDGDAALARARDAVAKQGGAAERWPEKTYRRGQMTELMATVHMQLLANDPWPAWTAMLANWKGLKSAMLPSLQFYRSWLRHGRARAALAAAEVGDEHNGWTRKRLLADAAKMAKHINKDTRPFAPPWAALIEGALAFTADKRAAAAEALERAVAGFDAADMALYREVARWRLGAITQRDAPRAQAEAWLRDQGITDPAALAQALAPGYGGATASSAASTS